MAADSTRGERAERKRRRRVLIAFGLAEVAPDARAILCRAK